MEHIVSLFQSLSNLWKILEQSFNIFNIFSGIYGNALYVVIFTFLHKKFAKRITWCFYWNPCPFKTVKQYTSIYDVYRIEEWVITNFAKGKKSNSFSNFFNSFLFKLTVRVKIGSIPQSFHNSFKYTRVWRKGKLSYFQWCVYFIFDYISQVLHWLSICFCLLCYYDL